HAEEGGLIGEEQPAAGAVGADLDGGQRAGERALGVEHGGRGDDALLGGYVEVEALVAVERAALRAEALHLAAADAEIELVLVHDPPVGLVARVVPLGDLVGFAERGPEAGDGGLEAPLDGVGGVLDLRLLHLFLLWVGAGPPASASPRWAARRSSRCSSWT